MLLQRSGGEHPSEQDGAVEPVNLRSASRGARRRIIQDEEAVVARGLLVAHGLGRLRSSAGRVFLPGPFAPPSGQWTLMISPSLVMLQRRPSNTLSMIM